MSTLKISTARVFQPLLRPARYRGAWGGRGSGKSHFFAGLGVERCIERPGSRGVCIREVQKTLKESAKLLIEDKIKAFGVGTAFQVTDKEIRTPGGGLVLFQGMQDHTAESIKSLEGFDWAWVEEAQTLSERSLEMLRPTIRAPGSEIWFSWNPRNAKDPVDAFFRGPTPPPNAAIVKANYYDNPWFPSELEDERAHDERTKRDRYGHIWLGDYEPAAAGAIWDRLTLHQGRRAPEDIPVMRRVVVGVDPATSSEPGSNETGVIAAGLGVDGRGYVLDDLTTIGSPRHWAERAVAAYDRHEAHAIVIETNQGGEMCRSTIESVRPGINIIDVKATHGKHVRAEPISALYSLGKISHVGTFTELEDQMCLMTAAGFEGEGSPDRVDALVWALTELFPQLVRKKHKTGGEQQTSGARDFNPHQWAQPSTPRPGAMPASTGVSGYSPHKW